MALPIHRTTYTHYAHLFPNREDDLNERLERLHQETQERLAALSRPDVVALQSARKRKGASSRENDSGRYWDRTSDLFGVNEALSR